MGRGNRSTLEFRRGAARLGRCPAIRQLTLSFEKIIEEQGLSLLAPCCENAMFAGRLDSRNRDSSDRILESRSRLGPPGLL